MLLLSKPEPSNIQKLLQGLHAAVHSAEGGSVKGLSLRKDSTQLKMHACMGPYLAQRHCSHSLPAIQCCLQDCQWEMVWSNLVSGAH